MLTFWPPFNFVRFGHVGKTLQPIFMWRQNMTADVKQKSTACIQALFVEKVTGPIAKEPSAH